MIQTTTISDFIIALRWFHLPVSTAVFACVGYVYYRFDSSRLWLGLTSCGLRFLGLVINFIQEPNINYLEITQLQRVNFLGESISMVDGVSNPWMLIPQLSYLFLAIFIFDAALTAWRRDHDRIILWLGGVLVFLVLGGSISAVLVFWEIVQIPIFITPFFMGFIIVMGIELGLGMLRATRFEREAAQQKTQLAHLSRASALSELSASLAHELNQPLGVILSNAEAAQMLLQKDAPDVDEIRKILDDIVSADRRAAEVIRRLRRLLQQREPEFEKIALNAAIEETLSLLRGELSIHGVTLDLVVEKDLPPVRADRVLMVQVMLNLITNAIDAVAENPSGERRVKIATASYPDTVEAIVSDNGSGLPEDPAHVFDPYFTTKTSGLGMGLVITRSIVTAHDGSIWADEDAAGYTAFHLSLPRSTDAT
jgi:signal transduction histidine kinase